MKKLLILIVLLPSLSWGAIAVVQNKPGHDFSSGTDVAVTVTSTTANLIVVPTTRTGSTDSVSSVTDNIGNTYVQATSARTTFGAATIDIWYCANATAGVTTVTVHWGVTATTERIAEVFEVSGFSTPILDVANHGNSGSAGNVITGSTVTTTSTAGFVAAMVQTSGTIDQNPNSGNECTAGGDIDSSSFAAACSILPVTAASHGAAWHDTSASHIQLNSIAAFKEGAMPKRRPIMF